MLMGCAIAILSAMVWTWRGRKPGQTQGVTSIDPNSLLFTLPTILAHARKVRLIGESRRKDDRLDAQTLARLARIDPGLLAPVKHRSAKAQADLSVIRARAGLVRARTALINTARGLTKSYGERLRGCNPRNMNAEKAMEVSPELRTALEPLLEAIASLSERICAYN